MNAQTIRDALTRRWPDSEYLHIYEAPLDAWRQGTKIDVLVVALWQSRGYELDAVEVKVSYSDWRNEVCRREWAVVGPNGERTGYRTKPSGWVLQHAVEGRYGGLRGDEGVGEPATIERRDVATSAKSHAWRQHAHRFWVACPAALALRIRPELPTGWGLIAVSEDGSCSIGVKATRREPTPMTWPMAIGIMRASADAGHVALQRAYERGRKSHVEAVDGQQQLEVVAS